MDNKIIQESLIKPIIIVNKMFLEQITKLKNSYRGGDQDFPDILENLRENLQELIQQYEEDESCH